MSQQIVPVKTYIFVFASLIALTLLTTGVAFIDLGPDTDPLIDYHSSVVNRGSLIGSPTQPDGIEDRYRPDIFIL